jgi:hypothetical protein
LDAYFLRVKKEFCLSINVNIILFLFFIIHIDYMNIDPGQIGLALVYLFQILASFQWAVTTSIQVEKLVII